MTGGTRTMVRLYEKAMADLPLADRWDALGEAIEQHGRDIDAALEAHRADCRARYGADFFNEERD